MFIKYLFVNIFNMINISRKMLIYLSLSLILCAIVTAKPFLTVKNHKIYDQNGGERIFHGVNLVQKTPPYYDRSFGQKDLKRLKSLGINGLRLGVMWPGVQPREDFFDQSYLKRMVDLVNLAGNYNIYTLVQFHQDLFSEKFCADGVPMWAIPRQVSDTFPVPVKKHKTQFDPNTGYPPSQACNLPWAEYYFTRAVNKAFGHLWKNKHGLLDKFVTYWKKVAAAFKGNPYVIAYQLMNQPWPGNLYEDPLVMVPGLSEKAHFQAAYDRLSIQIRSVDPDHNICFEPVTWLNTFSSGFTHPPGGFRFTNSSIFCYHYYNPPTLNLDPFFKARLRDIKRLKVGGLLSEFYIQGEQGRKNVDMMNACDQHSHSWFGWIYSTDRMVEQIKRTFAHRVAGTIINQKYNHLTKQYQLLFKVDKKAGATTIYVDSAEDYNQGFDVHIYPSFTKARYTVRDRIYLDVDSEQFEDLSTVMIAISP